MWRLYEIETQSPFPHEPESQRMLEREEFTEKEKTS